MKTEGITLLLTRHGNTFESKDRPVMIGKKTDLPLTLKGLQQAQTIGQLFQHRPIKAIFSGQLKRQMQTVEGINSQLLAKPKLSIISALNEVDYGPWEGLPPEQVKTQWPKEYVAWTEQNRWQDGLFQEPFEHRKTQLQTWLRDLLNTFEPGNTVMAVTSGGILRILFNWFAFMSDTHGQNSAKVGTGHYCVVHLNDHHWVISKWNVKP